MLGPLLFKNINELPDVFPGIDSYRFADDFKVVTEN